MRGAVAWLVVLGGCTDHTYSVGVDALANVTIGFGQQARDEVNLGFLDTDAAGGCPKLADDVVVKLGDTTLTGSRGSYSDGYSPDSAESGPPSCEEAFLYGPTPASTPATISLTATSSHTVTVVAPYTARSLATPAMLVAGTTANLTWSVASDALVPPASIDCITPNPGSPQTIVTAATNPGPSDVLLTYQDGVVSFPVPSNPTYHGPVTCYIVMLTFTAQVTDCTGFASCVAYPVGGPPAMFSTAI